MKIAGFLGLLAVGLLSMPAAVVTTSEAVAAKRPLRVPVYKKHYRGGYSVRKSDTYDTRRFVDPTLSHQSQGGPFDSGFFFETPRGPYGGTTPYFQ